MRCQRSTELMSLQLDNMLDQAGRLELEVHLAVCPDCRMTWSAMRQVSLLFDAAPMVRPAPGFADRVNARIVKRQSRRQTMTGYAVLAVGILLLMALPLTYLAGPMSEVGRAVVRQPDMVSNGIGLLARIGSIAGSFMEACWVLVRAVLGALPSTVLVPSVLLSVGLLVYWFQIVSGKGMTQRARLES